MKTNKMKKEKPLIERMICTPDIKHVKEAVEKLKLEEEDYELKVIGLVWGLCAEKKFDAEYFNIKMKEFGMNHHKRIDKIFGEFK